MTRLAKLRQQTQGTSSISSTSQVEQRYLLGSPASFVPSAFSQSVSIASMPPAVEFPPTPAFTDQMIYPELLEPDRERWPLLTVNSKGGQQDYPGGS